MLTMEVTKPSSGLLLGVKSIVAAPGRTKSGAKVMAAWDDGDGWDGWWDSDGWDGDGWDGWDGDL